MSHVKQGWQATPRTRRSLLFAEFEVRPLVGTITEFHHQLPTGVRPAFVGLPDVDVLAGGRVIRKVVAAGGDRLLNGRHQVRGATGYDGGCGIARGEDIQPLIVPEAELHRDRTSDFYTVERREKAGARRSRLLYPPPWRHAYLQR